MYVACDHVTIRHVDSSTPCNSMMPADSWHHNETPIQMGSCQIGTCPFHPFLLFLLQIIICVHVP